MNSDDKFNIILALGLAGIIATIIISCVALCTFNSRRMAELGYEETTVPGHDCTVWRKAD